jgi:hypothetical protein
MKFAKHFSFVRSKEKPKRAPPQNEKKTQGGGLISPLSSHLKVEAATFLACLLSKSAWQQLTRALKENKQTNSHHIIIRILLHVFRI